jgi:hypothetical protein
MRVVLKMILLVSIDDVVSNFKHCSLVLEIFKYVRVHLNTDLEPFVKDGGQSVVEKATRMLTSGELFLKISIFIKY